MNTTKPTKTRKRKLNDQQRIMQREAAARINAMNSELNFLTTLHIRMTHYADLLSQRIKIIEHGLENEWKSVKN
jgi:hypothetical protein